MTPFRGFILCFLLFMISFLMLNQHLRHFVNAGVITDVDFSHDTNTAHIRSDQSRFCTFLQPNIAIAFKGEQILFFLSSSQQAPWRGLYQISFNTLKVHLPQELNQYLKKDFNITLLINEVDPRTGAIISLSHGQEYHAQWCQD